MTSSSRAARSEWYERQAEIPMLLLAFAFLIAYAWPVLDPSIDADLKDFLSAASWTIYGAFAIDFIIRLSLAEHRRRYAVRHWYDVALIAVPMLRPLRMLRLLAFARILNRSAIGNLAGRVFIYVAGSAIAAVGLGALAMLQAERGAPDANIETAGDALWWAMETVTTVGYGDRYPVTTTGRFVAVALMIVGVCVVGSLTAVIASWLIEHLRTTEEAERAAPGQAAQEARGTDSR